MLKILSHIVDMYCIRLKKNEKGLSNFLFIKVRETMSYLNYELNHCPFCGADVKQGNKNWLISDKNHDFSIYCLCGACGPRKNSKEKAVMAWNRRKTPALDVLWKPFDLEEERSEFKGKLRSIDFSSVLQFLSTLNKSGILHVSKGNKTSAICLREGHVIATSSNFGKQLGEIIFDHGRITLEQLQQALDKSKSTDRHLGETLLDLGFVDSATLKGIIRKQVRETIQELMIWEDGTFQYRDCAIEFDEKGLEAINIVGMLLDVSRISDETTVGAPTNAVNQ